MAAEVRFVLPQAMRFITAPTPLVGAIALPICCISADDPSADLPDHPAADRRLFRHLTLAPDRVRDPPAAEELAEHQGALPLHPIKGGAFETH